MRCSTPGAFCFGVFFDGFFPGFGLRCCGMRCGAACSVPSLQESKFMNVRRVVLVFAVAIALGCGSTAPHLNMISLEDEWQLGAQMARDLSQQLQLVNDPD